MMMSSESFDFDNGFKYQLTNRNHHHKLLLHANFQPPTSVCNQNIGNFMFPYLQNDDVIKFDQFCRVIQISIQ